MNPTDTLAAHRPTDDDLLTAWPASDRYAVWSSLKGRLASDLAPVARRGSLHNPARRRLRRWVIAGAAASAVAVALTMGPALLGPDGSASAQAVSQLVTSAKLSTAVVIPPGKYLHMTIADRQTSPDPNMVTTRGTMESWTADDGRLWRRDVRGDRVEYYSFSAWPAAAPLDFTPRGTAAMPTDPKALFEVLDRSVQGSSSHHEAIFVAIGDMIRLGFVPPAVRAAAIEVAASLPEVKATRADGQTTLTFGDDSIRRGVLNSLIFDSATAALIGERATSQQDDFTYTSSITIYGLVDAVPAEVRERSACQGVCN